MSTAILRPSSVSGTPLHIYTFGSPNNITTNVNDGLDSSMIMNENTSGGSGPQTDSYIQYNMADFPTVAGTPIIYAIRLKCRWRWIDEGSFFPPVGDTSRLKKLQISILMGGTYYGGFTYGVPGSFVEATLYNYTQTVDEGPLPAPISIANINSGVVYVNMGPDLVGGERIDIADIWFEVDYNQTPYLDGGAPNAAVTDTLRPIVQKTYHDYDGDALQSYQMKAFSAQQYGAVGFNVDTSLPDYDTGIVSGSVPNGGVITSYIASDLRNGSSYRFYFRAKDAFGVWSAWGYSYADITVKTLAVPSLSGAIEESDNRVLVVPQGRDNLLDAEDADFRDNLGTWHPSTSGNCALSWANSASPGFTGAFNSWNGVQKHVGCAIASSAGNIAFEFGYFGCFVVPNEWYTGYISIRSIDANRLLKLTLIFMDAAGATLTSFTSGNFQQRTSEWINPSITRQAPPGAVYAKVKVQILSCASGEHHVWDGNGVVPGSYNVNNNGGFQTDLDGNGVPDGWARYFYPNAIGATGQAVIALSDEKPYMGNKSLKMVFPSNFTSAGNAWAGLSSTVYDFSENDFYTHEFVVWTDAVAQFGIYLPDATVFNGSPFNGANWSAAVRDEDGNSAGSVSIIGGTDPRITVTGLNKWVTISVSIKMAAGHYQQTFLIRQVNSALTCYVGATQCSNTDAIYSPPFLPNWRFDRQTLGSLLNIQRFEIQRRSSINEEGLDEWTTVKTLPWDLHTTDLSDTFQSIITYDYFAQSHADLNYRIRAIGEDTNGNSLASTWSPVLSVGYLEGSKRAWIKSSSDPSLNIQVRNNLRMIDKTVQKQRTTHMPLNSDKPIVVSGRRRSVQFEFAYVCLTRDEQLAIETLLDRNEPLLIQLPQQLAYPGRQFWVNLSGDYKVLEYNQQYAADEMDTIISGTFQEVRTPS